MAKMIRRKSGSSSNGGNSDSGGGSSNTFEVGGELNQEQVDNLNKIASQDFVDRGSIMAKMIRRKSGSSSNGGNSDRGSISSRDARTAVSNAKNTAEKNGVVDSPVSNTISDLQTQIQDLQSMLSSSQGSKQEGGSGSGSGSEVRIPGTDQSVNVDGNFDRDDEENVSPDGEELSEDVKAIIAYRNEQAELQKTMLASLNQFNREQNNLIDNEIGLINQSLENQQARVRKENERLQQASEVAGIVSGRARYSADEHMGIVSEVIQDGVERLNNLELEASKQKLSIRKNQREMNYEAFVTGTEILESINEQKYQTFVDVREQLNAEAERAREQIKFDQEQQDRAIELLGPEVAGMSKDQIRQVAEANGVPFGSLLQASQQSRLSELKVEDAELGIKKTELDMKNTRSIMAKRAYEMSKAGEEGEDGRVVEDTEEFFRIWGWQPPKGMDWDAAISISNMSLISNQDKLELARQWETGGADAVNKKMNELLEEEGRGPELDVVSNNDDIKSRFKIAGEKLEEGMGLLSGVKEQTKRIFGNSRPELVISSKLYDDAKIEVMHELERDAAAGKPVKITDEEYMDRIADKLLGVGKEEGIISKSNARAKKLADEINEQQKTKTTTPAVSETSMRKR